jgi:hypothetical protein
MHSQVAVGAMALTTAGVMTKRLSAAALSTGRWLGRVMAEHRKAQVATRLIETLRAKSDVDLAKLGVKREAIAAHVKERLYSDRLADKLGRQFQ